MIWHSHSADDVLRELNTDRHTGLSEDAARQRLAEYGENDIYAGIPKKQPSPTAKLRWTLRTVLAAAAVIFAAASFYGHLVNGEPWQWPEPAVVLLLLCITVLTEALLQRRERAILSRHRRETALSQAVRRDGQIAHAPVYALVPGDIIELKPGDVVPADCRLLETNGLKCNEAVLTDDDVPAYKDAQALFADIAPLAERCNMLYAGCRITEGQAVAVVVATGQQSEMGHLATLSDKDTATPMQKAAVSQLRLLTIPAILLSVVAGVAILSHSGELTRGVFAAAALAVATTPVGLTGVITAARAAAVRQDGDGQALVKAPEAIEAIAATSVLVMDTAHLEASCHTTLHQAFVGHKTVAVDDEPPAKGLQQLLRLAAIGAYTGDPDEEAIQVHLPHVGVKPELLLLDMPRVGVIPPDGLHRRAIAVHQADEQAIVIVKGTPEAVLPCCARGSIAEADGAAAQMSKEATRVTAVAYKILDTVPTALEADELACGLTLAGLLSAIDAPDPQAGNAIRALEDIGARTVLFSADGTAARHGILPEDAPTLTGPALAEIADEHLKDSITQYRAFTQMTAADKARVIRALQEAGDTVAASVASAEDTPATAAASVTFAIGDDSSPLIRDSAHAIVSDGSVTALAAAIVDARRTVDGIRRAWWCLLCINLATLLVTTVTALSGGALPLSVPLGIGLFTNTLLPTLAAEIGRRLLKN